MVAFSNTNRSTTPPFPITPKNPIFLIVSRSIYKFLIECPAPSKWPVNVLFDSWLPIGINACLNTIPFALMFVSL